MLSKHYRYTPVFPHEHEFFEILCLYDGTAHTAIQGIEHTLHTGDICIIHRIPLTVWGSLMTVLLLIFWAMLLRFHENDIESILTKDSTGNSVTEILNYLNRHYQSVTLREAAKHFGYSTSHFSTLIRESTGRTFLQIIRDIKLNQACHALRETSLSNLAICELVGYESPEHFMRTFKKTYGMTPGEYRKKNRE